MVLIFKLAVSLMLLGVATVAPAQTSSLQAELERVTASVGGSVGIGVRHLESGRGLYVNRGVRYPMASVFKVPVAIQLLAMVEEGRSRFNCSRWSRKVAPTWTRWSRCARAIFAPAAAGS
jgi:beta-lactamase class A